MYRYSNFAVILLILLFNCSCNQTEKKNVSSVRSGTIDYSKPHLLSKAILADKIKGGWAGQVIGCTYGGPTEFRYNGTMIQEYIPIEWDSTKMEWWYNHAPGLYDDVYMDLTFVDVFQNEGLDAPALSHAKAFANAGYMLWHANQAARYNILNGIEPPASGHWENNPHSEDIDFQIEADFAGLMSPGMINSSSEICDKIGHIMNYGDGWYGGVYVAAMYSLAFISDDINFVVKEALKSIPAESDFYQCMADVIQWHAQYPEDWRDTWAQVEKHWSSDIGCPDGVFVPFNIDAKINSAYIVIGLLYGQGDYGKTIDISTRCGQDSDCNPASVAGILGTMLGYSKIPDYWKQGLKLVEDMDFKYTSISLNDVYEMSFNHALENIKRNQGNVTNNQISISLQQPVAVKLEKGFEGHFPVKRISIAREDQILSASKSEYTFGFEGIGFILNGTSNKNEHVTDAVQQSNVFLNGTLVETVHLPTSFTTRRHDICWKYNLPNQKHEVKIQLVNPQKDYHLWLNQAIIYNDAIINYSK